MNDFKSFEEKLLSSYTATLSVKGREICEEVDSFLSEDFDLIIEKAAAYCTFCMDKEKRFIDKDLYDKCDKYLRDLRNYKEITYTLDNISRSRKMV